MSQRTRPKTGANGGKTRAEFYRRSPFLVSFWNDNQLFFQNFRTGKLVSASPETAELLDFFSQWRSTPAVFRRWPQYTETSLRRSIRELAKKTLLECAPGKNPKESPQSLALRKWGAWNPAAGFFHFTSKDAYSREITKREIQNIERLMEAHSAEFAAGTRLPANFTRFARSPVSSEFADVLTTRRTWRKFSAKKIPNKIFTTLLDLSFGVQAWDDVPKIGKLPQKTSPSGGSLHPLEAYVLVRRVEGVSPGIYHYDSARHGVREIKRGVSREAIQEFLAGQWWFRDAALVVFLTAVFARSQWKYDYSRAYRAILIEAGHLCQTFCLTATWLGLAPFCTIAMADTAIEKALKVDGVSESVIYAMGAGNKP